MHVTWRDRMRACLGVLALMATLAVLHRLDHPAMSAPTLAPGWDPTTELADWVDRVGPVGLAITLLRLLAIALSWYLLLASLLHLSAGAGRRGRVATVARRVTGTRGRELVLALLGTGALATLVMAPDSGPASRPTPKLDTTTGTEGVGPIGTGPVAHDRHDHAAATPQVVDDVRPPTATDATGDVPTMVRLDDQASGQRARRGRRGQVRDRRDRWRVAPGDHFWRIACQVVGDGHTVDEARIRRYWRRLVDANRDLLVDGDNPDLLLPGQVLRLPPRSNPEDV